MGNEQTKGQRELDAFADFVRVARLPIDFASVKKRVPPEPDLLCYHNVDGPLAFELVEICDPNLARSIANPHPSGVEYIRTSDPSSQIIRRKLRRKYTSAVPIELLCYTAGRVITPADVIIPTIRPYLASFTHIFRRAWLLTDQHASLLWE